MVVMMVPVIVFMIMTIILMVMMSVMVMVVVMSTIVVVMVMVFVVALMVAARLMQGLMKFLVHSGHHLDRLGDMGGERNLTFILHGLPPFFELFHMAFVMFHPMLQHYSQLLDVIHTFSNWQPRATHSCASRPGCTLR